MRTIKLKEMLDGALDKEMEIRDEIAKIDELLKLIEIDSDAYTSWMNKKSELEAKLAIVKDEEKQEEKGVKESFKKEANDFDIGNLVKIKPAYGGGNGEVVEKNGDFITVKTSSGNKIVHASDLIHRENLKEKEFYKTITVKEMVDRETKARILQHRKSGLSNSEISEFEGIPTNEVRDVLKEFGIESLQTKEATITQKDENEFVVESVDVSDEDKEEGCKKESFNDNPVTISKGDRVRITSGTYSNSYAIVKKVKEDGEYDLEIEPDGEKVTVGKLVPIVKAESYDAGQDSMKKAVVELVNNREKLLREDAMTKSDEKWIVDLFLKGMGAQDIAQLLKIEKGKTITSQGVLYIIKSYEESYQGTEELSGIHKIKITSPFKVPATIQKVKAVCAKYGAYFDENSGTINCKDLSDAELNTMLGEVKALGLNYNKAEKMKEKYPRTKDEASMQLFGKKYDQLDAYQKQQADDELDDVTKMMGESFNLSTELDKLKSMNIPEDKKKGIEAELRDLANNRDYVGSNPIQDIMKKRM